MIAEEVAEAYRAEIVLRSHLMRIPITPAIFLWELQQEAAMGKFAWHGDGLGGCKTDCPDCRRKAGESLCDACGFIEDSHRDD